MCVGTVKREVERQIYRQTWDMDLMPAHMHTIHEQHAHAHISAQTKYNKKKQELKVVYEQILESLEIAIE